jgi:phosphoribosyl 1,2-cyclic phosphodiesterase
VRIHLLGTRVSLPTPGPDFVRYGGNTSCVAIAHDGASPTIMLDAGTGLANSAALLGADPFTGSVLLGHLHWDHIYGLPFFRAGDNVDARVHVYVPADGDPVAALDRVMSPPIFPIDIRRLRGDWEIKALQPGATTIEGFSVLALEIPHKGGRSFGFRIDDGKSSLAYLSDHSPISLGDGPDGHGEYHEAARRLAQDVDLLIHDSQYTSEEFAERHHWGHCTYEYAIGLARVCGVRRTLLFHHDPGRTDDQLDEMGRTLDDPSIEFAVEGSEIHLGTAN